jgi:hypothetical protein
MAKEIGIKCEQGECDECKDRKCVCWCHIDDEDYESALELDGSDDDSGIEKESL